MRFRMPTTFRAACELKNKVRTALFAVTSMLLPVLAFAQEHAPQAEHAAEGEHVEHSIGEMVMGLGWPLANFAIFLGVLYYFLNKPLKDYLAGRSATIRKDLVEAAELRATATTQLATIEQKLKALP